MKSNHAAVAATLLLLSYLYQPPTGQAASFCQVLAPPSTQAVQNQPAFAVKIEISETAIKPGAPLKITIQTTNISPAEVSIKHASSDFWIQIKDGNGTLVPLRKKQNRAAAKMGVPWGHRIASLKPGESFSHEVNLQEKFALNLRGNYVIHVRYFDPLNHVMVESNDLALTVLEDGVTDELSPGFQL